MGEGSMNGFVNMTMNELSESEIGSASLNTIEWIEIPSNSLNSFDMSRFVNMRGLLIGND